MKQAIPAPYHATDVVSGPLEIRAPIAAACCFQGEPVDCRLCALTMSLTARMSASL